MLNFIVLFDNPYHYNPMLNGTIAHERVRDLAIRYGFDYEYDPEDDYSRKIDCVINGVPFQVSAQWKSRRELKSLAERGIFNLPAGPQLSDEQIIRLIIDAVCEPF